VHAPPPAGGTQSCFVQPAPGAVQIPQLELQQTVPATQRAAPHETLLPVGRQVP
jgi:hypothetical protein